MASGIDAMRKTIREKEPLRPSTKLSQTLVAADVARLKSPASDTPGSEEEVRASSRRLLRVKETITQLRGDLDWIVMKALEKDRTRRYETANGFAMDLRRHLADEPVTARAPSAGYKFGKFVRRNKAGFAVAATFAVVLVMATGVSVWQARLARKAEAGALVAKQDADTKAKAERIAREESEAIAKFLTAVFQSPDPARDGRAITVAETLDKAVKNLDRDLATQPARQASLQGTLGSTYHALADVAELRYRQKQYAPAELLYREQLEILHREPVASRLRRPLAQGSDPMFGATANLGRLLSDWAWVERATNASAAIQHAREGESLAREALAAFSRQTNTPA